MLTSACNLFTTCGDNSCVDCIPYESMQPYVARLIGEAEKCGSLHDWQFDVQRPSSIILFNVHEGAAADPALTVHIVRGLLVTLSA